MMPLTPEQIEHTYLHELVHHVFYNGAEDDIEPPLCYREALVDRVAGLLHQALTTAVYK
jgi:hypothetical protein